MTELVLKGLVLRTADYKESSKILTVLTDTRGKITVSAKGAIRAKSRIAAACQPFAFSEMSLTESRERYYLNAASTIELFTGLTADLAAYALGCYFLELLDAACPETSEEPEALSLGLNALWLLAGGKKPPALMKSAFELRLMSLLGYRPELEHCAACGEGTPEAPVMDLRGGALFCRDCAREHALRPQAMDPSALAAARHIVRADASRVFAFSLAEKPLRRLEAVSEGYVREQLERSFRTLDYYKSLI